MLTSCVMSWPHQFLCKKETWKNPNNRWKAVELPNIDRERESLCIAWTTRRVSMNFSGKMWLIIIAKVCKSQGFTLSLEDKFLERLQGGGGRGQTDRPRLFRVKKSVPSSVFNKLELTQILLSFKTSYCNLKIRGLGKTPCEALLSLLIFVFEKFHFNRNCSTFLLLKEMFFNITQDSKWT